MDAELCPACGADLDEVSPVHETGYLYGLECSRCPASTRRSIVLPRRERVSELTCPFCGDRKADAEHHPDVLVVKEMIYEVCTSCGERCGVFSARRLIDRSEMTM
jgi:transcription elongation factor Elf1